MAEWETRPADWLPVQEAIRRILDSVRPLPPERIPLRHALGRVLAEPVASPLDHPPWDNSAMDGFAVRADDVRGARPDAPAVLRLAGEVPAGGFPDRALQPGQAIKIMTGAPIPPGADSVVRVEHTDRWRDSPRAGPPGAEAGETLRVFRDSDAGRNVRRRGEDIRRGETVLEAGRVLRPAEVGVLASVGFARAPVHRAPRVALLANGDELVDVERFEEAAAGRKIVNSNTYALAAAAVAAGADPVPLGIAPDDEAALLEHLRRGLAADVLVTTAGASVGEHDLMKRALDRLGFRLAFWRVRMRPGSPFSFGWLGDVPVFGLPGNPVSALVTFEVLVKPALRRMLGRTDVFPPTLAVRAAERIESKPELTHFLRARLERDAEGPPRVRLTGPQGSGILTSVSDADALLVVPEGALGLEAGEAAIAIPLHPPDPGSPALGF